MKEKKLGRGLDLLIGDQETKEKEPKFEILIREISANPDQPRRTFDEPAIDSLVDSIKEHGVIQPIVVSKKVNADGYMIIAGERRWRAAKKCGLESIPCVVKTAGEQNILEMALVENLQREDLNGVDRAKAYKQLAEKFTMTQEQIAKRVGKSRASVANSLRLLNLPSEILSNLSHGAISEGHAKALLMVADKKEQLKLMERIKAEGLSVREIEAIVSPAPKTDPKNKNQNQNPKSAHTKQLEGRLREKFGVKINISEKQNKGKISLYFNSLDEFDRIIEVINTP